MAPSNVPFGSEKNDDLRNANRRRGLLFFVVRP
jgi:hypothetical protein